MDGNNEISSVQNGGCELTVLSDVLYRCETESISDEQLQRVVDPVLQMIYQGKFARRARRYSAWHVIYGALLLEITITLLLIITIIQNLVFS